VESLLRRLDRELQSYSAAAAAPPLPRLGQRTDVDDGRASSPLSGLALWRSQRSADEDQVSRRTRPGFSSQPYGWLVGWLFNHQSINQSIIYLYQTNGPYQRRRKIDNKKKK